MKASATTSILAAGHDSDTMAPPTDRGAILKAFRNQVKDGKPIVGAGAGTWFLEIPVQIN